ncbi:MAG: asparaginase [Oscillospiraceae bacterium]|nr:asparaginase [Oscillospiraceae bacterium]
MINSLLITTGGAISCVPTEKGLRPNLRGADLLKYSNYYCDVLDFKLIDSSVMTDPERQEIARLLWENREKYDSFVITHGTDSMAYTAAYLACALQNFDKTVVLTGSQLPMVYPGTDAVANLNLALKTALTGEYYGICIAIGGRLLPAESVTKMETEGFAAFDNVDKKYLTKPIPKPDGGAKYLEPKTDMVGVIYITPNLSRGVILSYVAMDAVLVLLLGAGGMPAVCEAALERLQAAGVKVYIKSQCMYGKVEEIYAAHSGVKKFIPVKDESIEYTIYRIMFDLE